MAMSETERVAREFFETLYAGDAEKALELFAEDGIWWLIGNLPGSGRYVGPEGVLRGLLEPFAPVWEGNLQQLEIANVVASGNHAVLELSGKGTTAIGNRYENFYCYVVRVRDDGLIDRIRCYTDTGYALGLLWGQQRERPPFE